MPSSHSTRAESSPSAALSLWRSHLQALLGAAIAMVGALATVHPTNAVLVALSEVVPRLAVTLPPVITACGALLAARSEPPEMGRRR
jgi:hypothetical protein